MMSPTINNWPLSPFLNGWLSPMCSHSSVLFIQWLSGKSLQFCGEFLLHGPVTYLFTVHGINREMGSWILFTQIFGGISLVTEQLYLEYYHNNNQTSLLNSNQQYQAYILEYFLSITQNFMHSFDPAGP